MLVIARTQIGIPWRRVTRAKVGELGIRIIGTAEPGRATTVFPHVAGPAFIFGARHRGFLTLEHPHMTFNHWSVPDRFAGFRIACLNRTDNAKFTTGVTRHNQRTMRFGRHDQWGGGIGITRLIVTDRLTPDNLARFRVKRHDFRVKCTEVNLVTQNCSTTIDNIAARQNALWQPCIVLPQFGAGCDINRPHTAVGARDIHDAILDQWL